MENNMNRNKKIAMVSPPAIALENQIRKTIPPFGLLTVGATVEERGYDDLLLIDSVVEGFENVVPDSYEGYSFHSYEALPLPTEKLSAKEVITLRDDAFNKYHNYYYQLFHQKYTQYIVCPH